MSKSIDHEIVNNSLQEILSSKKFSASPQMSAFLSYVVAETLKGNASRIKAYTIAIDGLGKADSFDPQRDPSVRVLAKRLRDSLDAYYAENTHPNLTIKLKAGSYVPHFIPSESESTAMATEAGQAPSPLMTVQNTSSDSERPVHLIKEPHTPAHKPENSDTTGTPTPVKVNPKWRKPAAISTAIALLGFSLIHDRNTAPVAPVVYMNTMSNERSLVNHLSNSISSKMIENGNVDVKRVLPTKNLSALSAKDYQLLLSSMEVGGSDGIGEQTQVDVQLIQAKTGRIVDSKSFKLSASSSYKLSEISAIENYANSLAHANGPLALDYHGKDQAKPTTQQK